MIFDYFALVAEGIAFLIALGSIIGLLGLILSMLIIIFGGVRRRGQMVKMMIISLTLLMLCGFYTGIKYFRIF